MTPKKSSAMPRQQPIGLVLSGGRGTRVDGLDKGLMRTGTTRGVEHSAGLLAGLCDQIFISANRHLDEYRALGLGTVIRDTRDGYAGPLAGLEALIRLLATARAGGSDHRRLLLLPCDVPTLSAAVPASLLQALDTNPDLDVVYADAASGAHYLCAALRLSCLASITAQLDSGQHAVRHWYAARRSESLGFFGAHAEGLRNYNRRADWEDGA